MWDLASGRNAFIGANSAMPDRSFWYYLLKRQGKKELLEAPELQQALKWTPNLSNCPELDLEISQLLEDDELPTSWRDFLSTIFVGRTMDTSVNAGAKQRRGQAWVGISFQYTSALAAYIPAYDRWAEAFSRHVQGPSDSAPPIQDIFRDLALSRPSWADERTFAGTHTSLLTGPYGRGPKDYGHVVLDAEMFIIGHEYGHHLLGHTSSRAKEFGVTAHLRAELKTAGLYDFVFLRDSSISQEPVSSKAAKNPALSQTEEMLADLIGLKIAAISRGRPRTMAVYQAMIGATCALLAEADIKQHWFLLDDDSHPSTTDRISLLLHVMPKLFHRYQTHGVGDSVDQLTRQLAAFSTSVLQSSLHGLQPVKYPPPTWRQATLAYQEATLALATTKANLASTKFSGAWKAEG